jgi:hypothetical protein
VLVTAWLLALTGILLAYGYWGQVLMTLAGAAANSVLAYRVARETRRSTQVWTLNGPPIAQEARRRGRTDRSA